MTEWIKLLPRLTWSAAALGMAAAVAVAAWLYARRTGAPDAAAALPRRLAGSPLVAGLVALMAFVGAAYHLDLATAAPRDVMQEVASVELYDHGQPIYQIPLTPLVAKLLGDSHAPGSLGAFIPRLRRIEGLEIQRTATAHWVDAHPPVAVLVTLPFVHFFGVYGGSAAIAIVSPLTPPLPAG